MQLDFLKFITWILAAYIIPWNIYKQYQKSKKSNLLNLSILALDIIIILGITFIFLLPVEKAHLEKPRIDIAVSSIDDPCHSHSVYPQHEFEYVITNINKESAQVTDLNIEFFFPNTVVNTMLSEAVYTGGPIRIFDLGGCSRNGFGEITHRPFKHIAAIRTANIVPLKEDSNIALFKCEKWPKDTVYYGRITIDLNKMPQPVERVFDIGKFRAIYNYKVGNMVFESQKFIGKIPEADTKLTEAEYHFASGMTAIKSQNCRNAINMFNRALNIYPEHKYALKQRGICNGELGNHDLAFKDFSNFIEIAPRDDSGYYLRGVSNRYLSNIPEAKNDFFKSYQLGNKKALKEYCVLSLRDTDPQKDSIRIGFNMEKILKELPFIIIPKVGNEFFEIHAVVDKNAVLRVFLSNSFSKNSELVFDAFSWLNNRFSHPQHSLGISWGNNINKLYLDGVLVDFQTVIDKEPSKSEDPAAYALNYLKKMNPEKGGFVLTISNPKLFENTTKRMLIVPPIYQNGIELSVYKDIDNILKILISNKYGYGIVLKYSKLNELPLMPTHPNHSILVTWSNGKTRLYIDGILSDLYPPNKI